MCGRRTYEQQGAPVISAPPQSTVKGLTELVENKAIAQGVFDELVLTDGSGFLLAESTFEDGLPGGNIFATTRATSKNILARLASA